MFNKFSIFPVEGSNWETDFFNFSRWDILWSHLCPEAVKIQIIISELSSKFSFFLFKTPAKETALDGSTHNPWFPITVKASSISFSLIEYAPPFDSFIAHKPWSPDCFTRIDIALLSPVFTIAALLDLDLYDYSSFKIKGF